MPQLINVDLRMWFYEKNVLPQISPSDSIMLRCYAAPKHGSRTCYRINSLTGKFVVSPLTHCFVLMTGATGKDSQTTCFGSRLYHIGSTANIILETSPDISITELPYIVINTAIGTTTSNTSCTF